MDSGNIIRTMKEDSVRRERVTRACASCRRKKIKCDGKLPCSHCVKRSTGCVYEGNKFKKPKTPLQAVSARLQRLESLIAKIADKVGPPGELEDLGILNQPSPENNDSLEDDLSSDTSGLAATESGALFSDIRDAKDDNQDPAADSDLKNSPSEAPPCGPYKGHHLGFGTLFSPQSVKQIRATLPPSDYRITIPLETLHVFFGAWKHFLQGIWTDFQPMTSDDIFNLQHGEFLEDQELTRQILGVYDSPPLVSFACSRVFIDLLFDLHYKNKTLPPSQQRKFTQSELMLMSMVLCVCLSYIIDRDHSEVLSSGPNDRLNRLTISQLSCIQEKMFKNSTKYYQRIQNQCEGVTTIQALLMLAFFIETSWPLTDINHGITACALRHGYELGLHRFDLQKQLSPRERVMRTQIWLITQYLHVESSYRLGKVPLVNMADFHFPDPESLRRDELKVSRTETVKNLEENASDIGEFLNYGSLWPLEKNTAHFLNVLTGIKLRSYRSLFSANVNINSARRVREIVSSINNELTSFRNRIHPEVRPTFAHEPGFEDLLKIFRGTFNSSRERIVCMHLSFFDHCVAVNRVLWQVMNVDDNENNDNSTFKKLSLDAARTILHLVRTFDDTNCASITLNWILQYPFSAAINLLTNCINFPDEDDTFKDLSLIIDISMNFLAVFSARVEHKGTELYYRRVHMIDLIVRIVLRIAIKVVEQGKNLNILLSNAKLKDHLEHVELAFPEFYSEVTDVDGIRNFLAGAAPYPPQKDATLALMKLNTPDSETQSAHVWNFPHMSHQNIGDNIELWKHSLSDFNPVDFPTFSNDDFAGLSNYIFENGI